jgi:ubiquinone biosynthesis protein
MPLSKMVGNLIRTQEILRVLLRHGFGDLLHRMGLSHFLKSPSVEEVMRDPDNLEIITHAGRFRDALEELGGAFVKLGQVLSTKSDIFPRDWIEELASLQDRLSAVEFEQLVQTLESDLGPIENSFEFIDPEPMATGSIAQVHRGRTLAMADVVVKIRKPGIEQTLLQDCDILHWLAERLERHVEESRNYRPVQIVEEFRAAVIRELDFMLEARNLEHFRSDFQGHESVVFPMPYWDQTTERVLTMERLDGIKISLNKELEEQGVDCSNIAQTLADGILRQVLQHGFFHGDPHPGNLMVVEQTKVGFLDCGMVGRLDERMRENLVLMVAAGIRRDAEILADLLIDMNALPEKDLDRERFLKEASLFLDRYSRLPLKRIRLAAIVEDATELINRFKIRIPSDLLLVGKALITLEGVGRSLDPDFDAVATSEPFIKEMVFTHYGPRFVGKKIIEGSRDVFRLLRDLPGDLRELSRTIRDNELKIVLDHRGLKEAFHELDRASKRISTSIIIASVVLGSSIMILSGNEPSYRGIPILGLIGLSIAGVLAIWLIVSSLLKERS